jgi:hypothetical protein
MDEGRALTFESLLKSPTSGQYLHQRPSLQYMKLWVGCSLYLNHIRPSTRNIKRNLKRGAIQTHQTNVFVTGRAGVRGGNTGCEAQEVPI